MQTTGGRNDHERAIRRLHAHYVGAVNRTAWGEFVDLFIPSAELTLSRGGAQPDRVVGPVAIGELIAGYIARYDFLVQVILNARIELRCRGNVDAASARLFIAELRQWTSTGRRMESAAYTTIALSESTGNGDSRNDATTACTPPRHASSRSIRSRAPTTSTIPSRGITDEYRSRATRPACPPTDHRRCHRRQRPRVDGPLL